MDAFNQLQVENEISDFVIVIYHGGLEYHHLPEPYMIKLFKFLIESGADCVVSHHTHRYSGLLYHKSKPILFGLGNLLSVTKNKNTEGWLIGIVARLRLEKSELSVELIPTQMRNDFSFVGLLPEGKRKIVLTHFTEISEIISNKILLNEYWDKENENAQRNILNILKSDSRFEYRIRKYLPVIFKSSISHYKLMNFLNIIRCSSQRGRLINILEKMYNKMNV
jgi:hypothetical protein